MFDLTKKKWISLFEESNSPARGRDGSPTNDPYADGGFQSSLGGASIGGASPTLFGRKSLMNQGSSMKAPNLRGANAVGAGVVHHH